MNKIQIGCRFSLQYPAPFVIYEKIGNYDIVDDYVESGAAWTGKDILPRTR
ncbi:MAG TPA: hypothetical protein PLM96_04335 [Methanoregulaceae archaeon]|nr:hypothetical protein [Methanolinea sp.]MDD3091806.1 hypothetical protein [Methanoregulaceae archaeon]MDD5049906.1 hypothetical protein [Methanoregulaceae archaeon]MDD5684963.1 hypothetical protein [Methanoregulaceae archaeon]HOP67811.1 hypothetical protein [Methanoregulaceae archaeon]